LPRLIEGMDKSLGDVLDHLDALGIADNTLVLFLGDNGSDAPLGHEHAVACAAPLRGKKGSHYEGGMRVPFIAAWAKANANNEHQKRLPIAGARSRASRPPCMTCSRRSSASPDVEAPAGHAIDGKKLDTLLTGKADSARDEKFLMHYPHSPHRTTTSPPSAMASGRSSTTTSPPRSPAAATTSSTTSKRSF
jgi:hypothetical protein